MRAWNVGGEYGYWLLKGNECCFGGGFSSNPILSGSPPKRGKQINPSHGIHGGGPDFPLEVFEQGSWHPRLEGIVTTDVNFGWTRAIYRNAMEMGNCHLRRRIGMAKL